MLHRGELTVPYPGGAYTIAYTDRPADPDQSGLTPILSLHGWGCSSADFAGAAGHEALAGRRLVAFDMPGCGDSPVAEDEAHYDFRRLRQLTHDVTQQLELPSHITVGHSYGGATAVEYAHAYGTSRVPGLVNVMGNMALSDCFWTGEVAGQDPEQFVRSGFNETVDQLMTSENPGVLRYAEALLCYSDAQKLACHRYAALAVQHSTGQRLLGKFIELPYPKLFVRGEDEQAEYLDRLERAVVSIDVIADAGHFPFVDQPDAYYESLGRFAAYVDRRLGRPR